MYHLKKICENYARSNVQPKDSPHPEVCGESSRLHLQSGQPRRLTIVPMIR
uniref:Uncharacterized protein n=1 Tax=Anguilla anguilla TaxID=7936 RepID=A0A0E9P8I8_ANGAN